MVQSLLERKANVHDRRADRYLREAEEEAWQRRRAPEEARLACVDWVSGLARWDLYATLTYDPARTGISARDSGIDPVPPSAQASLRHLARWHRSLEDRLGRTVCVAAALESTKAGWPHFHGLVSMGGCDVPSFVVTSEEWFRERGYVRLDRVDSSSSRAVAGYLLKYFTKASCEISLLGPFHGQEGVGQRFLTARSGVRWDRL